MVDDLGLRAKIDLTGELHWKLPTGDVLDLTRVLITCRGTFDAPEGDLRITLEGPVAQLAKLGPAHEGVAAMLPHIAGKPLGTVGTVVLEATPEHLRALAPLASPGLDPTDHLQNEPWMTKLFDIAGYKVVSVGTVARWTEEIG